MNITVIKIMAHLIDKDLLLKAIKSRRNELVDLMHQVPYASNYSVWSSNVDLLDEIKKAVEILEVKEVDLEKEIDIELDTRWRGEYLYTRKFRESAKHFFELGLKAQK